MTLARLRTAMRNARLKTYPPIPRTLRELSMALLDDANANICISLYRSFLLLGFSWRDEPRQDIKLSCSTYLLAVNIYKPANKPAFDGLADRLIPYNET